MEANACMPAGLRRTAPASRARRGSRTAAAAIGSCLIAALLAALLLAAVATPPAPAPGLAAPAPAPVDAPAAQPARSEPIRAGRRPLRAQPLPASPTEEQPAHESAPGGSLSGPTGRGAPSGSTGRAAPSGSTDQGAPAKAVLAAPAPPPRVAVINYHQVLPEPTSPWVITPERLEHDLRWFLDHGWRPLTLQQFRDWMAGTLDLAGDHFLLTFDDGYRGTYEHGYPVLERLRVPAVYFVVTAFMTRQGHWLNPDEVARVAVGGLVSAQSHTHDLHREEQVDGQPRPVIFGQTADQFRADLLRASQLLAAATGAAPVALAWPYGAAPDWAVAEAAQHAELLFEGGNRFVPRGANRHVPRFGMEAMTAADLARVFGR